MCRKKAPRATIILTALFPRNDNMDAMPVINRINASLTRLTDGATIRFLNVNDRLADREGRLFDGMMNAEDKLHPAVERLSGVGGWPEAALNRVIGAARLHRSRAASNRGSERRARRRSLGNPSRGALMAMPHSDALYLRRLSQQTSAPFNPVNPPLEKAPSRANRPPWLLQ